MGRRVGSARVGRSGYVAAWHETGRPQDRERQIALTLDVGRSLQRHTRQPLLRKSLRLIRAPARAAGLSELQHLLESGFDAFVAIGDVTEFLAEIAERECALMSALFGAGDKLASAHQNALEQFPANAE